MASENISVHGESIIGHKTTSSSKLGYLLPYLCNGVKGQPIAIFTFDEKEMPLAPICA